MASHGPANQRSTTWHHSSPDLSHPTESPPLITSALKRDMGQQWALAINQLRVLKLARALAAWHNSLCRASGHEASSGTRARTNTTAVTRPHDWGSSVDAG